MDPNDRAEQQAIMEMYLTALENGGENGGH